VFFLTVDRRVSKNWASRRSDISCSLFGGFCPINLIEQVTRPATLAARLFLQHPRSELLFIIIANIVEAHVTVGPVNLSLSVAIVPFFIQFFNLFVGTVQAFVFTLFGDRLSLAKRSRTITSILRKVLS